MAMTAANVRMIFLRSFSRREKSLVRGETEDGFPSENVGNTQKAQTLEGSGVAFSGIPFGW